MKFAKITKFGIHENRKIHQFYQIRKFKKFTKFPKFGNSPFSQNSEIHEIHKIHEMSLFRMIFKQCIFSPKNNFVF